MDAPLGPGMKEKELRERAACALCARKIGETSPLGLFYKVTVERYMIDPAAAQRQTGLGLMIGAGLAAVMGPDEDLAKAVMTPITFTVCEDCAYGDRGGHVFGVAIELSAKKDEAEATV